MGLFTGLLTLPLVPVRGTLWLAEQIMAQAERELHDPAAIRHQLEEVDRLRAEGALSDEEADSMEEDLLQRLLTGRGRVSSGWEE